MAKKLGKLALFGALAGAAAAGTYYYLQKKNNVPADEFDDYDDFDDFDEDLEDDFLDESANNTGDANGKPHAHIPIDLDNAKERIGEKVIETLDKTKEKLEHLNVSEKIDRAKEIISDRIAPAAPVETEYTEMDMSAPSSAAYSDTVNTDDTNNSPATEQFFDDSEKED
ncbi:MAG: hypothetical protein K2N89_01485 [Lachnospiraceae bacterium]|nr:hypothetical protein [Lachnospiraceae bacterium]